MVFPYSEKESINDKLRSDLIEAYEKWIESTVNYYLQQADVPSDSIFDIVQSVKNNLNPHTETFVAKRIYGLETEIGILENEILKILNSIRTSDKYFRKIIKNS